MSTLIQMLCNITSYDTNEMSWDHRPGPLVKPGKTSVTHRTWRGLTMWNKAAELGETGYYLQLSLIQHKKVDIVLEVFYERFSWTKSVVSRLKFVPQCLTESSPYRSVSKYLNRDKNKLIHSQTSTVPPLKFGNGKIIASYILPGM